MTQQQTARQIDQMVAFIRQEAKEKAAEIQAKTKQEQDKQLSLMSIEGRRSIQDEYSEKRKGLEVKHKIITAQQKQKQLARKMNSREDLLDSVFGASQQKLKGLSKGQKYKELLQKLIVQGLIKLLEEDVKIKCRKSDVPLVKSISGAAVKEYQDIMKKQCRKDMICNIRIDEKAFVKEDSAGGVILWGHHNKIGCDNTLDTRLRLAFDDLKPVVRAVLFPSIVDQ